MVIFCLGLDKCKDIFSSRPDPQRGTRDRHSLFGPLKHHTGVKRIHLDPFQFLPVDFPDSGHGAAPDAVGVKLGDAPVCNHQDREERQWDESQDENVLVSGPSGDGTADEENQAAPTEYLEQPVVDHLPWGTV